MIAPCLTLTGSETLRPHHHHRLPPLPLNLLLLNLNLNPNLNIHLRHALDHPHPPCLCLTQQPSRHRAQHKTPPPPRSTNPGNPKTTDGVGTLIKNPFVKITSHNIVESGRILVTDLEAGGSPLRVINVYGPTNVAERVSLFT